MTHYEKLRSLLGPDACNVTPPSREAIAAVLRVVEAAERQRTCLEAEQTNNDADAELDASQAALAAALDAFYGRNEWAVR